MNASGSEQHVYIVSDQQLQNALLAEFLNKEGMPASAIRSASEVARADLESLDQAMFMVDFNTMDVNECISQLLEIDPEIETELLLAIFNVDSDESLGHLAGLPMINGGFLQDCPQDLLIKGVRSMFEGELWLPRKVLQQYVVKNRNFNKTFARSEVTLTDREVEVLKVLATGAKNSEIARNLNLSPHTIKTHIYNIFKKINASNRLQAVNWAQENL
jgi:LuxR family transcriptional regulator of csgAB operon